MTLQPDVRDLVTQLSDHRLALRPSEVRRAPGLDAAGLYSWWADRDARDVLSAVLGTALPDLIYAGQAGASSSRAGLTRAATLRSRVAGNHVGGNIAGSTFRRTLAALLWAHLLLEPTGSGRLDRASEQRLSAWMEEHLTVRLVPVDDRDALAGLEVAVLHALDPPLNLVHMPPSPVRTKLRSLRGELGRPSRPTAPPSGNAEPTATGSEDWLGRALSVRRWSANGERAPHKPLLLLYALGRLRATGSSSMRYADVEGDLQRLLTDWGPPRPTKASYPFRRLQNDGLWMVSTPSGEDPGDEAPALRRAEASGRLAPELEAALVDDPALLVAIARGLLEQSWPETLHHEIAHSVGLDLDAAEIELARDRAHALGDAARRRRDPSFRERVLVAYEYRCAFCGYDGRLGTSAVGLDAAHIRWWAMDGPDTVDNAVCLCSMHHRLLDLGVLGITAEHEIAVSKHFIGHSATARRLVTALAGARLGEPQPGEPAPDAAHLSWHDEQVFRGPARAGVSGNAANNE